MKINENELKNFFKELRTKDVYIFNEFYRKYNKVVYGIAFSILKNIQNTEDVVQIVFSKIYELDSEKYPTSNEASWIYTLTKNEAISYIRKNKANVNLRDLYEVEDSDYYIEKIMSKDSYNRVISNLNEIDREIISLKILSDLTFEQISEFLGIPASTVKWRYYKAIHSIKILIANIGLFVITFVIGLKNLFQDKKYEINSSTIGNDEKIEDNENAKQEITNKDIEDSTVENDIKQEIIIEKENNINYIGISLISISALFLIISIIFIKNIVKSQLKSNIETSK